jgi:hypothetical protein
MMTGLFGKRLIVVTAAMLALLVAGPAAAFRCGNKLVKDGMHEQQVVAICGEPETRRQLGYALRPYDIRVHRRLGSGFDSYSSPGFGRFSQEVLISESIYNFGPRKKMQRLVFEGGILVTIESIGYGYHKKKR